MATFISHNPGETEAFGETLGRAAQRGWVVTLSGDLGAGKTQFVRGVARGLGCAGRVHSPTFTLVNEYGGGRLKLFHLDLYRLETPEQILSAGIEDYLSPDGVSVIEWAERLKAESGKRPASTTLRRGRAEAVSEGGKAENKIIEVKIEIMSETERRIICDDFV